MQAKIQLAQTVLCHEDIEGPLQNESFAKVPFLSGRKKTVSYVRANPDAWGRESA